MTKEPNKAHLSTLDAGSTQISCAGVTNLIILLRNGRLSCLFCVFSSQIDVTFCPFYGLIYRGLKLMKKLILKSFLAVAITMLSFSIANAAAPVQFSFFDFNALRPAK
jgi:hypothetical protein